MPTRYDTASIRTLTTDPQTGFLHATNVPIARTGVFEYLNPDGSTDMEAKLPADILSDSTVASANNRPVTEDHPVNGNGQRILVDSSNSQQLMKGFTASNAHVDKTTNTVRVDMTITNPDLISKINSGKNQLSIGFQTQIVPQSGVYDGQKYDSVQRNIQINHVAVVDMAREGPSISLVGDSAEMVGQHSNPTKKGQQMDTVKIKAGGSTITVAADDADTVMKLDADNSAKAKQIASLNAKIKELTEQRDALQGKSDEAGKKASEAQAKADSADKELADYKKKFEGDGFEKAVEERIGLINKCKSIVGDSFDPTGKSAKDMKIEVIKKVDSVDLKDKDDAYINPYFDSVMNRKKDAVVGVTSTDVAGDNADTSLANLHASYYNRKK